MAAGAPLGNQNASKGRVWRDAINKALAKRAKGDQVKAMQELAEILLKKCDEGDMTALKEFGDRIDGKPHQTVGGDTETGEIPVSMIVKYVKSDDKPDD